MVDGQKQSQMVQQSSSNQTSSRETAALRSNTQYGHAGNIATRPSQEAHNLLLRNSNSGKMLLMQSNHRLNGGAYSIHETLASVSQLQSQRNNHGHSAAARPKEKSQYGSRVQNAKTGTMQADQRQGNKFQQRQNLVGTGQRQFSTEMSQQAQTAFIGMRGAVNRQRNPAEPSRVHSEATTDPKLSCLIMQHSLHGPNNHLQQFLANGTLSPRFNQHQHHHHHHGGMPIDSDDDEDEDANISDAVKHLIRKPFAQSLKAPPQLKMRKSQPHTYAAPSRVKDIYNSTAGSKMHNVGKSTIQRSHQNGQSSVQATQLKHQDAMRYPQTVIPSKFQNQALQLEHHKGQGYLSTATGSTLQVDLNRFGRLVGPGAGAAGAAGQESSVGGVSEIQPNKFPQIPNSQNQSNRPHYSTHKRSIELKELNSRQEENFNRPGKVMSAQQNPMTPFADQYALAAQKQFQQLQTQQVSKHRMLESSNKLQEQQHQQMTQLPQITSSHDKLITVGDESKGLMKEFSMPPTGVGHKNQIKDAVKIATATTASNDDIALKNRIGSKKTKTNLRNQNTYHNTETITENRSLNPQEMNTRVLISSFDERNSSSQKQPNLGNVLKQQESMPMNTVFEGRRKSETRKQKQSTGGVTKVEKLKHEQLFPQKQPLQLQHERTQQDLNEYDSDFEAAQQQTMMKKLEEQLVVANAHAELLDFFAQCEESGDEEQSNNIKNREDQKFFQHETDQQQQHERRKTNDFLRKNRQSNEQIRGNDINARKRLGYATNSGQVSSLFERVNSYRLLTQAIGKDANGNNVGASLDEFRIQRVLGTGAYAVVKLATHEATKKRVALKIYEGNKLDATKRKAIWQEIQCMKILQSSSFPKLYADFETGLNEFDPLNQYVLVQEYVSGQSLFQLLKAKGQKSGLPDDNAKFYFKQIVEAVKSMHGQLICHRDLKLENILVSDRQKVKIIDFGFSIRTDQNLKMFCGTSSYMSPEIIRKTDYNGFKADIWALGVVLYVLLTGRFPFKAKTEKELFIRIQGGTFLPPVQMNYDAKRLITRMLSLDPAKRPTAAEVLRDTWFMNALNNGSHDVKLGALIK